MRDNVSQGTSVRTHSGLGDEFDSSRYTVVTTTPSPDKRLLHRRSKSGRRTGMAWGCEHLVLIAS